MRATVKIQLTLMTILIIVLGLGCSLMAYSNYENVSELVRWEKMQVVVISAVVEKERRSKGTTYCPHIDVGFELTGHHHISALQISQTPCSLIKEVTARTVKKYGTGKSIEAYVNPSKPSEARLTTYSLSWVFYALLSIAALSFIWVTLVLPYILTKYSDQNNGERETK